MINKIIEQIKEITGVRTAFQVDDRIVVDLEEVKQSDLSCMTCTYFVPDNNPVCNRCLARDRHILAI